MRLRVKMSREKLTLTRKKNRNQKKMINLRTIGNAVKHVRNKPLTIMMHYSRDIFKLQLRKLTR